MTRTRVDYYDSGPIIAQARQRALDTLDQPRPKLTKLEQAFRAKYLAERAQAGHIRTRKAAA